MSVIMQNQSNLPGAFESDGTFADRGQAPHRYEELPNQDRSRRTPRAEARTTRIVRSEAPARGSEGPQHIEEATTASHPFRLPAEHRRRGGRGSARSTPVLIIVQPILFISTLIDKNPSGSTRDGNIIFLNVRIWWV